MFEEFCSWLESIYGGRHYFTTNSFGHKLLWIENEKDKFFINLTDRDRFGKFTLFHKNKRNEHFHKQYDSYHMDRALIRAYRHSMHKTYGILEQEEDTKRMKKDWLRYLREARSVALHT